MKKPHKRKRHPPEIEALRPKTRADCVGGPRPCPWVSCRYHLQVEVDGTTGIIRTHQHPDEWTDETPTCALDVADVGGLTSTEIAALVRGPSRQALDQSEMRALRKLNALADVQDLAADLDIKRGEPSSAASLETHAEEIDGKYERVSATEARRAFLRSVVYVEPVCDVPLDAIDLDGLEAQIRLRNGDEPPRHLEARRRLIEARPQTAPKGPQAPRQREDIQWI